MLTGQGPALNANRPVVTGGLEFAKGRKEAPMSTRTLTATHLPANINNNATLPALVERCKEIDRAVGPLYELLQCVRFGRYYCFSWKHSVQSRWSDENGPDHIAQARRALALARRGGATLATVTRAARPTEIAAQVSILLACYPQSSKAERELLTRAMCEHVADESPSVYVSKAACRRLLKTSKFISIAELMSAITAAKKGANRQDCLIESLPHLEEQLDEFEKELPRLRQEWLDDYPELEWEYENADE